MPQRTGESLKWLSWTWQKNPKKAGVTKTKKKKKKLQTRQSCIRALDKYFSLFIRNRDSDENWYITCVSCKNKFPWKGSHNCHFIDRAKRWYRWDERNCHAGCAGCNCYRPEYHMRHYTIFMIITYGEDIVSEMMSNDNKIQKIWTPEIREKLEFYKTKCKELWLK
jgi:hypothetical protein